MALRRPVWINRDMDRIAPELRTALRQDQEALIAHFRAEGAALPGYSRMPGDRDAHSRRTWAEYEAPQALQQLLDAGELSRDAAMQFAAATAMASLLQRYSNHPNRSALARVLRRMTEPMPPSRYPRLGDAADALEGVLGPVPMVSQYSYHDLHAVDLTMPKASASAASGDVVSKAVDVDRTGLEPTTASAAIAIEKQLPKKPVRGGTSHRWWYAAAAFGAALGTLLPLPW